MRESEKGESDVDPSIILLMRLDFNLILIWLELESENSPIGVGIVDDQKSEALGLVDST